MVRKFRKICSDIRIKAELYRIPKSAKSLAARNLPDIDPALALLLPCIALAISPILPLLPAIPVCRPYYTCTYNVTQWNHK